MIKQDLLSILITFVIGAFGGGYLYVTGLASYDSSKGIPDYVEINELVIISDVYGGCRDRCSSFQVLNDGSYRYLYYPLVGKEQTLRQGTLPVKIQDALGDALKTDALVTQSEEKELDKCNSYSDGIDVLYEITLNGETYFLDSCGTNVDGASELWLALNSVWTYFQNL